MLPNRGAHLEIIRSIFAWIGTNESVLSGIAAAIVIAGFAYRPIRSLLTRGDDGARATGPDRSAAEASPLPPPITDRPSIAVMPFANLSNDAEQEFLADGLSEDIILGLSRIKQLFVIARGSCFSYKGRPIDAGQVSRELGVRYVLEGSVRRSGDGIRVTAQLVDAARRTPVWAEHFDRRLDQITEVDDEVTEALIAALLPALRRAEIERTRRAAPGDLTAWALVNRAWVGVQSDLGDPAALEQATEACREALRREPEHAFAHAVLALSLSLASHQRGGGGRREEAQAAIDRALALAPDDSLVHHCHAALLGNFGRTAEAIRAWGRAIDLDPNSAGARAGLGIAKIFMASPGEALGHIDAALRRSPRDPIAYHWLAHRALALSLLGRRDEAEEVARISVEQRPSNVGLGVLAGVLVERGDLSGGLEQWHRLAARQSGLRAEDVGRIARSLAPDPARGEQVARAMQVLGAELEKASA